MLQSHYNSSHDLCLVRCLECGDPMRAIYDPSVRTTCAECGGRSLAADPKEVRAEIRREYLSRLREARRA